MHYQEGLSWAIVGQHFGCNGQLIAAAVKRHKKKEGLR
jgi:hypothetical protein